MIRDIKHETRLLPKYHLIDLFPGTEQRNGVAKVMMNGTGKKKKTLSNAGLATSK